MAVIGISELENQDIMVYHHRLSSYHTALNKHLPLYSEEVLATTVDFFIQPLERGTPFAFGVIAQNHEHFLHMEFRQIGGELEVLQSHVTKADFYHLLGVYRNPGRSKLPDIMRERIANYIICEGNVTKFRFDTYTLSALATLITHPEFLERTIQHKEHVLRTLSIITDNLT
jgi:hypothetical protein